MVNDIGIVERVRASAAKRILYLPHAIKAMARPTAIIARSEVEAVLLRGEVIEDYVAVITAYVPDPAQWSADFRQRKS